MKKFPILLSLLFFSFSVAAQQRSPDWQAVAKVFDQKGAVHDDIFKIAFPRSDLKVTVGEVHIDPGLALTSWIAFKQMGNHTVIMGDLVLLEEEIAPVMNKLARNDINVTGLHNHIVGESPRVMYMHFSGVGDPVKIAVAMKDVLSLTNTPLIPSQPKQSSAAIDWSKVESVLGWSGQRSGNLLSISIPRTEAITENGMEIPSSMGVATALNFEMIGKRAATTGDFALLANEVNPVIEALAEHGINVTAIHNHMLFESPRLFFLHFWGVDKPEKLAEGLRAALDKTNSVENNKK
jgi:hypothetical protein